MDEYRTSRVRLRIRRGSAVGLAGLSVALSVVLTAGSANAAPSVGSPIDPDALEQRMDDCMAFQMPPDEILMGWINFRDGAQHNWRCSSLRHMLLDDENRIGGQIHDPYENVPDFVRCTDAVVTGGFPRPGDPGNTNLIKQYNGTSSEAIVVINDATDDIVSIYTTDPQNDWTGCANAL